MSFITEQLGDSYKDDMSKEEVLSLIESVWKAKEKEHAKAKQSFDKTASEFAKLKKELNERQTEEEKAENARNEEIERLKAENEQYKRATEIADLKGKLIGLGYADTLASETAEALYSKDMDTFFANTKTMLTDLEKGIRAGIMKDAPTPPASIGTSAMTRDSIMAIKDVEERQQAIAQHIDLFR